MNARINKAQLDQIVTYILREYDAFGVQKKNGHVAFDKLEKAGSLLTWTEKPVIPFKKILWSNGSSLLRGEVRWGEDVNKITPPLAPPQGGGGQRRLAFLGLANCDAKALDIFLKEFAYTDLMPKRSEILVVTSECKPDEHCFCTAFDPFDKLRAGKNNFRYSDIHIQEEDKNFEIFALTKAGQKIIEENGVSKFDKKLKIREIKLQNTELLDLNSISKEISDKHKHEEYWQKIADQCFACGACTIVCPLCFCFRQNSCNTTESEKNELENEKMEKCTNCISWDSCYSASFSKITSHDFRPQNADRLHNWYHHKFSRSMVKNNYPLCTGCGRCISACPANLNQHGIIKGMVNNTNLSSRAE